MLSHLKTLRAELSSGCSEDGLDLLGLAIASLEKLEIHRLDPHLSQIAVLGPTQAGKSTLVNALVGTEVTTVSALAGHTRHARGAAFNVAEPVMRRIGLALDPAQRVDGDALSSTNLDQYSLAAVESAALHGTPGQPLTGQPLIVWDTPDFDSLAADTYRRAVLAIAGMADVIVLIVSRDKYGDMAVWELLDRLAVLRRQSAFVVNKVDPATWKELSDHVAETQRERLGEVAFEVLSIDHAAPGTGVDVSAVVAALGAPMALPAEKILPGVRTLIELGWEEWLAPVVAEDEAQQQWREDVASGKAEFMNAYRRDYLADADRYDTFQRLLGELLVLLEIPFLARSMGSVRRIVTWPVRKVFGAKEAEDNLGREPELLQEAAVHLLLGLRMKALESSEQNPLWKRLAQQVSADQTQLLEAFEQAATAHHEDFQLHVAEAAQELYQRLQENPALLNSLRVIRAGADAAGVVVALQTGGIGLADLVLTPAMLSLTSTLTESAAKTYVDQIVDDLKEKQFAAVSAVLDAGLVGELSAYADNPGLLEFAALDAASLEQARNQFFAQKDDAATAEAPGAPEGQQGHSR